MALWNSTAVLMAIVYTPDGFMKLCCSEPGYRKWSCSAVWNSTSIHLTIVSAAVFLAALLASGYSFSADVMAI